MLGAGGPADGQAGGADWARAAGGPPGAGPTAATASAAASASARPTARRGRGSEAVALTSSSRAGATVGSGAYRGSMRPRSSRVLAWLQKWPDTEAGLTEDEMSPLLRQVP